MESVAKLEQRRANIDAEIAKFEAKHTGKAPTAAEVAEYKGLVDDLQFVLDSLKCAKRTGDGWTGGGADPESVARTAAILDGAFARSGNSTYRPTIGKAKLGDLFTGPADNGGFDNFNAFLGAVERRDGTKLKAFIDRPSASMTEGLPSEGGFLVPTEYAAEILDRSLEQEIVRPRARVWPMKSDTLRVPCFDDSSREESVFGGIVASWSGELATNTETSPTFRQITLNARKLNAYARSSSEVLEDVADAGYATNPLDYALSAATGYFLDYAFLWGNGAGKPLGVFESPCLVTVSKETGQEADTINYVNLCKMFARNSNPTEAVWVVNRTAIPMLLQLGVEIGTAGQHIPVMTESNGQFRILGRPCLFSEKMKTLGELGDIGFLDLGAYAIGLRKEVTLEKTNSFRWLADEVDWRARIRVDGQPTWDQPLTPRNGETISPFVALQAR